MNIGFFGGTFDPPHSGHLIVAQDALLALGLDRVLFVPAAAPPHKQGAAVSPAPVRARMLELAIEGDPRFALSRLELDRTGPSYTVDSLRELADARPGVRWTLLLGADQYAEFDTWRDPAAIRGLAGIAVLTRRGTHGAGPEAGDDGADRSDATRPAVVQLGRGDVAIDVTRIDISATSIRARIAAGLPVRYLVPPQVEAFIHEQRLYHRNGASATG